MSKKQIENVAVTPRLFIPHRRPIITPDEFYGFRRPQAVEPQDIYHAVWEAVAGLAYDQSFLPQWAAYQHKYCDQIVTVADAVRFANEALAILDDPYTRVLDPEKTGAHNDERVGTITGIGVVFELEEDGSGNLVIARVLERGPADKGGLKSGDALAKVDGTAIAGKERKEIIAMITGKEGSTVKITVIRDGAEKTFDIVRGIINVPTVRSERMGNVAYIKLSAFMQDDTVDEMVEALKQHADADAYIIGLRYNPGGQVMNCIRTASLFLDEGEIVSIRQRIPLRGYQKTTYRLRRDRLVCEIHNEDNNQVYSQESPREANLTGSKPVVVLVDNYSASASEMFAGALKDLGRATIVGKSTHGKGIGQTVQPMLGGTTLIATSLRYYNPSGHWVGDGHNNKYGVTPHHDVDLPDGVMAGSPGDTQLSFALEHVNSLLKG